MHIILPQKVTKLIFKTLLTACIVGCGFSLSAKEGMWLPPTLKNRETDMKAMGLQIPIDKIYNEAGTGLNNAVVLFGSGCTGEIISSKGLLLTNHHCGYGTVQGLSSREKDYFANGFWAMNNGEEIPCPGLSVTFIRKMENVTDVILNGIADTVNEAARTKIITERIAKLEKGYCYTTKMDASIKPYFNGNQYWVSVTETYKDIRLVGFPPNGIGQFGGDTDNWMWPRHTGDFSMFRVYAGAGNKPADYAAGNKPYQTTNFFTINTGGYKEGDFTMVYGFPGTTQEYISSYQLNQIYKIIDPIRIEVRTKKLGAWTKAMEANRDVFLKYTSKRANVANGWKKWQGEIRGLKINNVPAKKEEYEDQFTDWAAGDATLPYADNLLANILANTSIADSAIKTDEYIKEAILGIEIIQQASMLDKMLNVLRSNSMSAERKHDSLNKLNASLASFYKNYDVATDKEIFQVLMPLYFQNNKRRIPDNYRTAYRDHDKDYSTWADDIYRISLLADKERLTKFASDATVQDTMRILSDPAWQLYNGIAVYRRQYVTPVINLYNANLAYYNRLYMRSQMRLPITTEADNVAALPKDDMGNPIVTPDTGMKVMTKPMAIRDPNELPIRTVTSKPLYPDANLTLRLTYGTVQGVDPDGPASYSYQTNLDEAVAKDNPDVEEFRVPQKLKDLQDKKDYGRWAVNGTVPTAFIAANHTTGGNSGSPVLNAKGELIGTNFDRIWEGTMSDLYYDPNLCRNISQDVRYTLFVVEKFGGAGWLLKEMKLVGGKK